MHLPVAIRGGWLSSVSLVSHSFGLPVETGDDCGWSLLEVGGGRSLATSGGCLPSAIRYNSLNYNVRH